MWWELLIKIVEKEVEKKKKKKVKREEVEKALMECNFDPDCAADLLSSS